MSDANCTKPSFAKQLRRSQSNLSVNKNSFNSQTGEKSSSQTGKGNLAAETKVRDAVVVFARTVFRQELERVTAHVEQTLCDELRKCLAPMDLSENAEFEHANLERTWSRGVVPQALLVASTSSLSDASVKKPPDLSIPQIIVRSDGYTRLSTGVEPIATEEGGALTPASTARNSVGEERLSFTRKSTYILDRRPPTTSKRLSVKLDLHSAPVSPRGAELSEEYEEPLRETARDIVEGSLFTYAITFLICANAICLGIQTDYMAKHWTHVQPRSFVIIDGLFCAIFCLELALRIGVYRLDFFHGSMWLGNWFDLILIAIQTYDDVVVWSSPTNNEFDKVTILRLLRLSRLLRLARILHLVAELRRLIVSIMDSFKSVGWALGLLVVLMYVVGVFVTQTVTNHKVANKDAPSIQALDDNYGTLSRSMMTLFEAIASGVSWREVLNPLQHSIGKLSAVGFCAYIAFTLFVLLNVVTGVFVCSATEKAKDDTKTVLMFQLREFFRRAATDDDQPGVMSWEKFRHHFQDPELQGYLIAMDLHEQDATDLFFLLDTDDSDGIDEHEFVNGCLQLHGVARSLDLAMFMRDYASFTIFHGDHARWVQGKLGEISSAVNAMAVPLSARAQTLR